MCIPSKFSNWHALILEAVSIVEYMVCTCFVTVEVTEDCKKQTLCFALVIGLSETKAASLIVFFFPVFCFFSFPVQKESLAF